MTRPDEVTVSDFHAGTAVEVPGSGSQEWVNDEEAVIPQGIGTPFAWRLYVMPVKPRTRTRGGIIVPDMAVDAQTMLTYIGRLAAIGPGAFKHAKYTQLGMKEEDFPKVGDFVIFSPNAPMKFEHKGVKLVAINDDHIIGRCDSAQGFKIYFN